MKKISKAFITTSIATLLSVSYSLPGLSQTTYTINKIESIDDLKAHPELVEQLSNTDRQNLAEALNIDPTSALWLNIIPFGVGSFSQGDIIGGVSIAVMDLISIYFLKGDIDLLSSDAIAPIPMGVLFYLPLFIVARVTGVASPIMHANANNDQVKKLLFSNPTQSSRSHLHYTQLFSYSMAF